MKKSFTFLLLLLIFSFACQKDKEYPPAVDGITSNMPEPAEKTVSDIPTKQQNIEKQIIKTANILYKVKDYNSEIKRIRETIKKFNAYIEKENEEYSDYLIRNTLTIRVRYDLFDSLITALLKGNGEVIEKTITTRDITTQVIDLKTRLKNKQAIEEQYRQLLKKARTVQEIMEVTEALRKVREEIESTQAQLKYLRSLTSKSTINLTITQPIEHPKAKYNFLEQLKQGYKISWQIFQFLLILILIALPYLIIIWLIKRFILSQKKTKNKSKGKNNIKTNKASEQGQNH